MDDRGYSSITSFIKHVHLRLQVREVLSSLTISVAIGSVMLLLSPLLLSLLPYGRGMSIAVALGILFMFFCSRLLRGIPRKRRPTIFFGTLDKYLPDGVADAVRSAIELENSRENRTNNYFSDALIDAHTEKVAVKLKEISSAEIPLFSEDSPTLIRFSLLVLLFVLFLDMLTGSYRNVLRVFINDISLAREEVGIVRSIDVRYAFPAYTGLPSRELSNTDGNLNAIKGSVAEISLSADNSKGVAIVFSDGERIGMAERDGRYYAKLSLLRSIDYHFEVKKGRRTVRDGLRRVVNIQDDAFPEINIIRTGADERLSPESNLLIPYNARDDYGLTLIRLIYEKGEKKSSVKVKEVAHGQRELSGEFLWALSSLNLKKGDEVNYWLEAVDNDMISGPKVSRSETRTLRIGTTLSRDAILESTKAFFEEMVDSLAYLLEGDYRRKVHTKKFLNNLSYKFDSLIRNADSILRSFLNSQARLSTTVRNILSDLNKNNARLRNILRSSYNDKEIKGTIESVTEELEQGVLELHNLLRLGRLEMLLESGEDLLSLQQELMKKFEKGKEQELLEDIRYLEDAISEMLSRLAESLGSFPEGFINEDALKHMEMGKIMKELERLRSLLREGKIDEARALFQEFISEYARMLSTMRELMSSASLMNMAGLLKRLDDTRSNIAKLEEGQKNILNELRNILPSDRGRDNLQDFIEKVLKKVLLLKEKLEVIERKIIESGGESRNILDSKGRLRILEAAVRSWSLSEALQHARGLLTSLDSFRRFEVRGIKDAENIELLSEQAAKLAQEIIGDIEEILKRLTPALSESTRKQLRSLAGEETALEQRTRQLAGEMKTLEEQERSFDTPVPEMLSGAADFMKGAGERLNSADQHGGINNAEEALRRLGETKDYIDDLKKQAKMPLMMPVLGPGYSGFGGLGNLVGRVELPGEQESQYQKEIKEELLRAIRDGMPEKFQDENRRYYRELMK